jgi:hypothetical protein
LFKRQRLLEDLFVTVVASLQKLSLTIATLFARGLSSSARKTSDRATVCTPSVVKRLRRHLCARDALRFTVAGEIEIVVTVSGDIVERSALLFPREVLISSDAWETSRGRSLVNRDQLLGLLKGNAFNNTAFTTLKIVVFTPIASIKVMIATTVNPGCLIKLLKLWLKSFRIIRVYPRLLFTRT